MAPGAFSALGVAPPAIEKDGTTSIAPGDKSHRTSAKATGLEPVADADCAQVNDLPRDQDFLIDKEMLARHSIWM